MIHVLIQRLKATSAVTDLVTATSITPVTMAQAVDLPAIVVNKEGVNTNQTKDKGSGLDEVSVDISVFAEDPGAAYNIQEAVRDCLDNFRGEIDGVIIARIDFNGAGDGYEMEPGNYTETMRFTVYLQRDAAAAAYPDGLGDPVTIEDSEGTLIESASPGATVVVADTVVSNSDDSYSESVKAEQALDLPDITLSRTLGDASVEEVSTHPAVTDILLSPIRIQGESGYTLVAAAKHIRINAELAAVTEGETQVVVDIDAAAPDGIAYVQVIPQQRVSQANYDAAALRGLGAYDITRPAYPEVYAALDFDAQEGEIRGTYYGDSGDGTDLLYPTMLVDNNRFDNKYRFTDSLGNPSDSSATTLFAHMRFQEHSFTGAEPGYVIDHLLGIGFLIDYVTIDGAFCMNSDSTGQSWADWLADVYTMTKGSYSDWFVPSLEHCMMSAHAPAVCKELWTVGLFSSHYSGNRLSMLTSTAKSSTHWYPVYDSNNDDLVVDLNMAASSDFTHRLISVFPIRIDT